MNAREHQGTGLSYISVEPDGYVPEEHYPLVVLLHGFGSHMGDLVGLCPAIDRRGYVYLLPNAPRLLGGGFGAAGYAWAPLTDGLTPKDTEQAESALEAFLTEAVEEHRVGANEVVVSGFSQGGMMAYLLGLTAGEAYAGVAALSGVTPDIDRLRHRLAPGRGRPIFMAHGSEDTMIPIDAAREFRAYLEGEGYEPEYREYNMGHEVGPEEIEDLASWVKRVLPPARA